MSSLDVTSITRQIRALRAPHLTALFKRLPTALKYLVALIFLLNVRSWPFGWHFRIFRPVFKRRFEMLILKLRTMFYSREKQARIKDKWEESIAPIGDNPLDMVSYYRGWASVDESDFNGHLSNSSYAKTLDAARFKAAIQMFPLFFREGGWIPLAATHYHFIREIPMLATYEIRSRTAAWDSKWVYLVHKFVTKPKGGRRQKGQQSASPGASSLPSLRTATSPQDISSTGTPSGLPSSDKNNTNMNLKSVSNIIASEEPDGAILHTVVVSQLCFKIGRITIPPELVFAINGFTGTFSSETFSHSNLPPHWDIVRSLGSKPNGGGRRKMGAFLKGGWREVPQNERWWEEAFVAVQEQRAANLEEVGKLKQGLENARLIGIRG